MRWDKGITASFYCHIIDPETWREVELLQITGGQIERSAEGLRDSADLDCVNYPEGKENYIRVYMDAHQEGGSAHVPIFTGLAASPSRDINGTYTTNTVQCYSILKVAQDVLLPRGYYIPKGTNGATAIKDLLRILPSPVEITGTAPTVSTAIIAEDGENRLSMTDKVLTAIGWRMILHGDGHVEITPQPDDIKADLAPEGNDIIEQALSTTYDWYEAPNVFRAVRQEAVATARDNDQDSPWSIVNRGREVWMEETNCTLNSGESLTQYARRRLAEEQQIAFNANYTRRFLPDVYPGDNIRLRYPGQKLVGIFRIIKQSITLGHAAKTQEEVKRIEEYNF